MKAREADLLGAEVAAFIQAGRPEDAYALLAPVLAERTPFRLLDRIGRIVGAVMIAFRLLIESAQGAFLPGGTPENYEALSLELRVAIPVAGGLIIGLMGFYFPQVFGVGYEPMELALTGQMALASRTER